MATVTGDAVFDAIVGFAAGGSGLTLVSNGTTDTDASTIVNANGSITIGNSFRFITERLDINTGRGTGNADNLAIQQDNGSQTIITLDTGTTQQDDVILGDLSLSGQLVRAATGTAPYIFGSAGTPTGDITTGDAADGNNYEWSMVNPEPLTITGTQSNITLHLANLDPFNSMLQVNSVGNSTLQSPAVNAIFGRTPSDTADIQAVDGTLQATWGYADRFVHQLSPVGNGNVGGANYLSCYGLRTHYNVAPMLANTTTDYQQIPPAASNRRQMLQTNANLQVWLVRPLNGTDPLESTDLIPIGYHSANFPGANTQRLDNEIRVIIPHRLGFTDSVGATINDDVKVFYENRTGETFLEIRNAPATFNPTTIPTLLTGNELTITNSTTNGVWIMDAINVFSGRTTTALRQPLQSGNEVAGMNGDRTYILRSYRYDFPYQNNLGFGSVMTDAVTATQDIIPSTQDLQPFLNGRTPTSFPVVALTDWADFFPAIRVDFFDGAPDGAFPLVGAVNTITFPGDLTLTTQPDAHNYAGNDVTIRVANSTTNTISGEITHFILAGTADMAGTNIPNGMMLDGGTWTNFAGDLNDMVFANDPTLNLVGDTDIRGWTTTGAFTFDASADRVIDIHHAQASDVTNLDGLAIPADDVAARITVTAASGGRLHFDFPEEETRTRTLSIPNTFEGWVATATMASDGTISNITTYDYTGDHTADPAQPIQDTAFRGTTNVPIVVTAGARFSFNLQVVDFPGAAGLTQDFFVLPIIDPNYVAATTGATLPAGVNIGSTLVEDVSTGHARINITAAAQTAPPNPGWNTAETTLVFATCRNDRDYIMEILEANGESDWITITSDGTISLSGTVTIDRGTETVIQYIQGVDFAAGSNVTIQQDSNNCPTVIIYPDVGGITTTQVQQALRPDLSTINSNVVIASVKPGAVQTAQGGNVQI